MSEIAGASVVIIGGGATGLSAGWWLAQAGVDVVVLDSGIVGWGASGRNGGGCSHHFSPLFVEEQRLWPQMDALLGYPTEFQPKRIRIAYDERQLGLYGQAVRNAARQGFGSDLLDAQQVREMVPLAGEDAVGGYFYKFGGHANPHRTVQAYAWAMQDHGGRVLQHTRVENFRRAGGRVVGVVTDRGEIGCDHVVIAAGPATGGLAAMLDLDVPMVAARAEMIVTEPLPLMPLGGVDGNGLYGRQTLRGNLAYGGGPHEWIEFGDAAGPHKAGPHKAGPPPSTPLMSHIAGRLARLFPRAGHARIIRSWAGVIENTPDGRPIIDRPSETENVVIATLSSIGFGLSPATGHAIAELVQNGACSFADLSSFALSRFRVLEPDWRSIQGWRDGVSA
jgi:sarcosine oxidase subunit beta